MKEKVTRKQQQIDFERLIRDKEIRLEVSRSIDYILREKLEIEGEKPELLTIKLLFTKPDIESDIKIRLVVKGNTKIDLRIYVITPNGVKNVKSKLDMRALLVSETVSIQFVPILEIDEKDVSVDHKSAIGRPDHEIVQYMKSRGIADKEVIEIISAAYLAV